MILLSYTGVCNSYFILALYSSPEEAPFDRWNHFHLGIFVDSRGWTTNGSRWPQVLSNCSDQTKSVL